MRRLIASALVLATLAIAAPADAHAGLFGRILGRGPVSRTRTVTRTRSVVRGGGAAVVNQGFGAPQQGFGVQSGYGIPQGFGAQQGRACAPAQQFQGQQNFGVAGGY